MFNFGFNVNNFSLKIYNSSSLWAERTTHSWLAFFFLESSFLRCWARKKRPSDRPSFTAGRQGVLLFTSSILDLSQFGITSLKKGWILRTDKDSPLVHPALVVCFGNFSCRWRAHSQWLIVGNFFPLILSFFRRLRPPHRPSFQFGITSLKNNGFYALTRMLWYI